MFLGSQYHQLDAKNRIRIPAKYKDELGSPFYLAKGSNNCIYVMSKEVMDKNLEPLKDISSFDSKIQKSISLFAGSVEIAEEDAQGRIILPKSLRNYAKINKDIVTIGVIDRLEIWAEEERTLFEENEDYSNTMQVIADKDK